MSDVTVDSCGQPGCTGTLRDAGGGPAVCDTCGLAPAAAPGQPAGQPRGPGFGPPVGQAFGPPASQAFGQVPGQVVEAAGGATAGGGAAPGAAGGGANAGVRCVRDSCGGTLEDVGGGRMFCDTCGLAPLPAAPPGGWAPPPPPRSPAGFPGHPGNGGAPGSQNQHSGSQGSRGSRNSQSTRSSRASKRSVSGRLSRSPGGSGGRSLSVRTSGSKSPGSGRGRLGAGLVAVPPIPRPDPATAVLADPKVAEHRRYCGRAGCGAPVGRSRGGRPGRTEGFCTQCGHPYSFTPRLRRGDVVRGQYEVLGCLAYGGQGWIYLAVDRAVANRWVVLKGLLDTSDQDAIAAAVSERRFLAEIEHPNIVRIYNFVEHLDQRTGTLDGYIVMEYVGGKSLKEIANGRRTTDGRRDPLPVGQAVAFAVEALEALGHLHSRHLLYCDFKVDNAIQQEDRLKLIDMGAVRRMDDFDSPIFGTVGYQAPEVAEAGPSVASDLYTVARTLAVLTFDFQGYTSFYVDSLPDPGNIEVFSRYESFYRLLVRATDPDPGRRFSSAEEMADQLMGVLREVVALESGVPRPALSTLFGPEIRVVDTGMVPPVGDDVSRLGGRAEPGRRFGGPRGVRAGARPAADARDGAPPAPVPSPAAGPSAAAPAADAATSRPATAWVPAVPAAPDPAAPVPADGSADGSADSRDEPAGGGKAPRVVPVDPHAAVLALPVPHADPADPNAGFLAGLASAAPSELLAALRTASSDSVEMRLRELRARLEIGDRPGALGVLSALTDDGLDDDWRVVWYRGVTALATGDHETAALAFDAVYDAFPGETAPKLALGICAEVLGQLDNAADYYGLVWATDPSYVSAAFGYARVRLAAGDRAGAVGALESVPESSIHYIAARVAAVRGRLRERSPRGPLLGELRAAAAQVAELSRLGVDADLRERLTAEVLGCALDWVLAGRHGETAGGPPPSVASEANGTLLGSPLTERGLRFGLERSYRVLARLAQQSGTRIELVERANRLRPRTWV